MAVDVYPAKSPSLGTSPRISFSHDLIQNFRSNVDDPSLLDPTFDFDFSTGETFAFELSLADDIFSNGVILPAEIKPKKDANAQIEGETERVNHEDARNPFDVLPEPETTNNKKKIMRLKEFLSCNNDDTDQEREEKVPLIKPFWKFGRSISLNYKNGSLIRPLQFFSRSKSTGSASAHHPTSTSTTIPVRVTKERRNCKQPPLMFSRSSSCNSYYPYNSSKRPPALKKSFSRSYVDNGIRVSPVLHFSHACMAKGTATLFGLRSLFCNGFGKSRGNRK